MQVSWESLASDHILGGAPSEPGMPIEEIVRQLGLTGVLMLASTPEVNRRLVKAFKNVPAGTKG